MKEDEKPAATPERKLPPMKNHDKLYQ